MLVPIALATVIQAMPMARFTPGPNYPPACGAPPTRTDISDPPEIRSQNGQVQVTLFLDGHRSPTRTQKLCYSYQVQTRNGVKDYYVPPTLHLIQGERIVLTVVDRVLQPRNNNRVEAPPGLAINRAPMDNMASDGVGLMCGQPQLTPTPTPDPVTGRIYGYHRSPWNETNMHFHGLNTSPKPPSDDVLNVIVCPRQSLGAQPQSYTYVVDIPRDEPPGLYWYHPHPHGESEHQVQRGLTGAIIVDPIVSGPPQQMTNRVIVVRDFLEPNAKDVMGATHNALLQQMTIPNLLDIRKAVAAGLPDVNDGTDGFKWRFGVPAHCPAVQGSTNTKAITINEVQVPLGIIAVIDKLPHTTIAAGETQFWRLANTGSDTVLDLQLRVRGTVLPLQVVSRDGVPLMTKNGHPTWQPVPMDHVIVPPAGRVEFYLTGTSAGDKIVMRTRAFDAGCLGDVELERAIIAVHVVASKGTQHISAPRAVDPVPARFSDLALAKPTRQRTFVFTEYPRKDEPEPDFYLTEISNPNAVETPFMMKGPPAVTVKNGTVEDWTLLNFTQEVHEFHIHQIHFLVLKGGGLPGGQSQILDTVNIPFGVFKNGGKLAKKMTPGMVKVRMDFRGANILGEFVYHCHILEHEDNGMMQKIRVEK